MPPSERVSRHDVIQAALAVVESEGLGSLTARRVAAELKSSTAPVYRSFASMEDLARVVMERARDQLVAYSEAHYTDRRFLDMGTGIAVFAREHPRLYRALFLETDQFRVLLRGFLAGLTDGMRDDPRFADLPHDLRAELLDRMWTHTHGLASMIAVGLTDDTSTERIVGSLDAVGSAVIRDMLARR
jgi:AcrR family transcriptional regulator